MSKHDKFVVVHSGLIEDTPFWRELYIHGCKDLLEFYHQVNKFIRMKELYQPGKKLCHHEEEGISHSNKGSQDKKIRFLIDQKKLKWEGVNNNSMTLSRLISHIYVVMKERVSIPITFIAKIIQSPS